MSQGYSQDQSQEPLLWNRVEWRQGDGRYVFEVAQGGLHARLTSPHGTALTLPMVAWEGLLDALAAARKTRTRAESKFPARSGARWYDGEAGELAAAFKAGRSIRQLARAHNRTEFAVEAQLDRQGLWDRIERRPKQAGDFHPPMDDAPEAGVAPPPTPIPFGSDRD
jgi:hypothetical protein